MRMSSSRTCGNRPSTPSLVVFRPISSARLRPSEVGSMPTIHTGSSTSLRCSLYSRSVPILPGPIRAQRIFLLMGCLRTLVDETQAGITQSADVHVDMVAGTDRHQRRQRAGQDDFAPAEGDPELAQGVGQPGDGLAGVALDGRTQAAT